MCCHGDDTLTVLNGNCDAETYQEILEKTCDQFWPDNFPGATYFQCDNVSVNRAGIPPAIYG